MSEPTDLCRVTFRVRPLPGNPRYWDCQFGFLLVWLYSNSPEDANARADKILDELPYERIGTDALVVRAIDNEGFAPRTDSLVAQSPSDVAEETRVQLAKESGLSLLLLGVNTGADEAEFEKRPLSSYCRPGDVDFR